MPTYQDSFEEIFPHDQVQVVALNQNSLNLSLLEWYVNLEGQLPGTPYTKPDTLTFPMIYNTSGTIFNAYDAGINGYPLPGIFLIDQAGKIRLRYDGASEEVQFWPEFTTIMDTLRWLLENPPNH